MSLTIDNPGLKLGSKSVTRLETLLRQKRNGIKHIDYKEAELYVERLAALLLEAYSRSELKSFYFLPIARGGYFVLGMLTYFLDISRAQKSTDLKQRAPLLVVDDSAYTGTRFRETLENYSGFQVVFATLFSHPELRKIVEHREKNVRNCLAVEDLKDYPKYGDERRLEWSEKWMARLDARPYWIGSTEAICYPWSEPKNSIWNHECQKTEEGWFFSAPERCLRNWAFLKLPPRLTASRRQWFMPENVAYGVFDDVVWLVNLDSEQVISLSGVGVDFWRAIVGYGEMENTLKYLNNIYVGDEEKLRVDVMRFVKDLRKEGFLI